MGKRWPQSDERMGSSLFECRSMAFSNPLKVSGISREVKDES